MDGNALFECVANNIKANAYLQFIEQQKFYIPHEKMDFTNKSNFALSHIPNTAENY